MSNSADAAGSVAPDTAALVEFSAEIVGAYVAANAIPASEMPNLLVTVHATLAGLGKPGPAHAAGARATPPVSIRRSVTDTHLISLEDGRPYKALKRHLSRRGMTPADYRAKWGLPSDYPMVAPAYARARSALAKKLGLGVTRRKR